VPEAACARRRAAAEAREPAVVPAVRALRHVGAQHRVHALGKEVRIRGQNAIVQRVVPVVASAAEVEHVLPAAPPDGGDELVVVEGVVQEMHPLAAVNTDTDRWRGGGCGSGSQDLKGAEGLGTHLW